MISDNTQTDYKMMLDRYTDDPDLGELQSGHVCKHGVRWPHRCDPCADAAWKLYKSQSSNEQNKSK
jgi:hypothetical protein